MSDRRARATLATTCTVHFLHDGFSDLLYVLLPIWTRDFSLSLAQAGLLRSVYSGAMSTFQIPAGFLAERVGEARLLTVGTAVVGAGFVAAAATGGYLPLLALLLLAGLGSGVQHPLSASLTSRAYEGGPLRVALGTYNFSGDLGKVTVPALIGVVSAALGWQTAVAAYGAVGLGAALLLAAVLARLGQGARPAREAADAGAPAEPVGWGIRDAGGFQALSAVHGIDSATRTGFLTLLPFVLIAKGSGVETVGAALALVFAGGAVGKFVCGAVAERVGIIRTVVLTEAATAALMLGVVLSPLAGALALLPVLGMALNGTSSVLYGTVADFVVPTRRARAYGLFYTVGIGAGAAAPTLYGLVGDRFGTAPTMAAGALVVLATLPFAQILRRALAARDQALTFTGPRENAGNT
ncbi:MAG TPA: MFS transporter [Thermodesulfobacteriota bacterium]